MKRTNKFIGSPAWRERDLSVFSPRPGAVTAKDRPSGITVTYWNVPTPAQPVADLIHRVRQLEGK